ncbi:MAG TPA: hypothetical protein VFS43_22725 [Polyangiaceae bacterium]|nr:hypothetical protein [Polyangiaceae bacterium]
MMRRTFRPLLLCLPVSLVGLTNCGPSGADAPSAGAPTAPAEGAGTPDDSADLPEGEAEAPEAPPGAEPPPGAETPPDAPPPSVPPPTGTIAAPPLAERDVTLLFDPANADLIRGSEPRGDGDAFLPSRWFDDAVEAFPFESRPLSESPYDSWELISARADVCAPLGPTPAGVERWCWPEFRLVWQSFSRNYQSAEYTTLPAVIAAYPEDRALHATYDVAPESVLAAAEAAEARALRQSVAEQLWAGASVTLPAAQAARFEALRDLAVQRFAESLFGLRAGGFGDSAYEGFAARPELAQAASRQRLLQQVRAFLVRFTPAQALKQLTGFSLNAGRLPTQPFNSAWDFISLLPSSAGELAPQPLEIRSRLDGRLLVKSPLVTSTSGTIGDGVGAGALRVGTGGFDGATRLALEGLAPADRNELLEVLVEGDITSLLGGEIDVSGPLQTPAANEAARARAADRRQLTGPNAPCVSCHQLESGPFKNANFHNLSAFGFIDLSDVAVSEFPFVDQGVSVSPRVKNDVAYELDWLRQRRGGQ